MDVIGLDATVAKGTHGLAPASPELEAKLTTCAAHSLLQEFVMATDVFGLLLDHLT